MSYTGNGAIQLERLSHQDVEQGTYSQESTTRVTSAGTVSLTTPQSGGWATRIGHGCYLEQLQEQPAKQLDHINACTTQTTEREAQITHSARKRKESPTNEEQIHNRPRHMEVQASWEHSKITLVTQASRPITVS
jgi:hypothetical protein